jgi:hypothetical protein
MPKVQLAPKPGHHRAFAHLAAAPASLTQFFFNFKLTGANLTPFVAAFAFGAVVQHPVATAIRAASHDFFFDFSLAVTATISTNWHPFSPSTNNIYSSLSQTGDELKIDDLAFAN